MRDATWLDRFYRGERSIMEQCYRDHFADVRSGVGRVLRGADQETVIHDVFVKLMTNEPMRRGFTGGSLGAWLARVGVFQAIDYHRKYRREVSLASEDVDSLLEAPDRSATDADAEAREFVRRFREKVLPAHWGPVFQACFLDGLDQRSAAAQLKMPRTTLAYQWLRIKWLLDRFAREGQDG